MKTTMMICAIILVFATAMTASASPAAAVSRKVISKTVKAAAMKSGKALTPALRRASEQALRRACQQYGDDVLKVVAKGGLETLEQGAKHGNVFWKTCLQTPKVARSVALHADDLLPIAKRLGPDVVKLEAKAPGLAKKAVTCFGDDAVKYLAKLPPSDAATLIRYGAKADSPKTATLHC